MVKGVVRFALNALPRPLLQRLAPLGVRVLALGCLGRGVECPVCGRRYRRFLPYGYGRMRPNALCPGCMALERHRLMHLYLRRRTDFYTPPPGVKVLHVAPEACFIKRFRKLLGAGYVTGDLFSPLADVKMDVQDIPFPDNHFDIVFCNHIMEHVDDDRRAMRELYRVLKPGGWGIIQSPVEHGRAETYEDASITSPEERSRHFGQYDHLRVYGADYPARLAEAGFNVTPEDFVATLTPSEIKLYALPGDETIFRVGK